MYENQGERREGYGQNICKRGQAPLNTALVCVDMCKYVCVCVCVCVEGGYRAVPYSFKFLGHSIQRTLWTNVIFLGPMYRDTGNF